MNKLIMVLMIIPMAVFAEIRVPDMTSDNGYVEPFRMFDNVYYIGDKWVSSYVVETSAGLVIIDTLDFPYSQWIPANLKKLGLNNKSVTHIIVTHGHSDHVGGAEFLQALHSSKVIMTQKGFELAKSQALKSHGDKIFLPPVVTSFAQDSSRILVGDTEFKFYITHGHTEGDLSIDFMVKDGTKRYRAFVVGGHGVNFQKPDLAHKFIESMERVKKLALESPAVKVNLSNHPHKNNLFSNRDKNANSVAGNAFVSDSDFLDFITDQEKLAIEKIQNKRSKMEAPD